MTEADWIDGDDAVAMVRHIEFTSSDRKVRLLMVAVARLLWDRMRADHRRAVEAAERYADDPTDSATLEACRSDLFRQLTTHSTPEEHQWYNTGGNSVAHSAALTATFLSRYRPSAKTTGASWWVILLNLDQQITPLIHCIFGNPFRPVTFSEEWRTITAVALAKQMYDSRDFSALPILADALQDAGCDQEDILNHCRSGGGHVRGCWVVDLVMGKE